jgi:hypothetical protein
MPKQLLVLVICLGMLLSCNRKRPEMQQPKEHLSDRIERLGRKYQLQVHYFDAECLYDDGDLAATLSAFLTTLLPGEEFHIVEVPSADGQQVLARVSYCGREIGTVYSNAGGDYLPGSFYEVLEAIPAQIGSSRCICMVNPRLFGQDGCYVSGTLHHLQQARHDGLPLVLPDEAPDEWQKADLSEFE